MGEGRRGGWSSGLHLGQSWRLPEMNSIPRGLWLAPGGAGAPEPGGPVRLFGGLESSGRKRGRISRPGMWPRSVRWGAAPAVRPGGSSRCLRGAGEPPYPLGAVEGRDLADLIRCAGDQYASPRLMNCETNERSSGRGRRNTLGSRGRGAGSESGRERVGPRSGGRGSAPAGPAGEPVDVWRGASGAGLREARRPGALRLIQRKDRFAYAG